MAVAGLDVTELVELALMLVAVGALSGFFAGIFGIAHGYGWVGLLSVCWSGVLWAWIYEKTGSLLPGILAHAINNLLVCLAVMALLR